VMAAVFGAGVVMWLLVDPNRPVIEESINQLADAVSE